MENVDNLKQKPDEQVDIIIDLEKTISKLHWEKEHILNLAIVDLRSIIQSLCSSLVGYCIWNKKNIGDNEKIYLNMIRTIHDRESKALKLFDERLENIKNGGI